MNALIRVRPLCTEDLFPMAEVLAGLGVKNLRECFDSEKIRSLREAGAAEENIGEYILLSLLDLAASRFTHCREPLLRLLSGLTGETGENLAALPPADFLQILQTVVRQENFLDFLSAVSELLNGAA